MKTKVYNREDELIATISMEQAQRLAIVGSGSLHYKDGELIMVLWVDKAVLNIK